MSLYVETLGCGPDLVLLHGWGMNGAVWRHVAAHLAEDYCVHLVDLPGHGRSGMVEPYTLDELVREIDAAFPLPLHVVGWSLGGAVALRWRVTLWATVSQAWCAAWASRSSLSRSVAASSFASSSRQLCSNSGSSGAARRLR